MTQALDPLRHIQPAMHDLVHWYARYSRNAGVEKFPESLEKLAAFLKEDKDFTFEEAQAIVRLQAEIMTALETEDLNQISLRFSNLFDALQGLIKHLSPNENLNPLTGLRGFKALEEDYIKESERFYRQGKAFTMCLIRSDALHHGKDADTAFVIKTIAEAIAHNIRLFDDYYHLDNNLFLVSLKHTDETGGIRFLLRLQRYIERIDKSSDKILSVSGCIAEPAPKEDLSVIMQRLTSDLNVDCGDSWGEALVTQELSPLQQYLQEEQEQS